MEKSAAIRHPIEWAQIRLREAALRSSAGAARPPDTASLVPAHIDGADLRAALSAGFDDFLAFRSDVIVLCIIYPLAGAILWRFASGADMLQMVFPLVAGFALVGPLFATGLYEMSRQREAGEPVTWQAAFDAFRSPAILRIATLGVGLLVLFGAWLLTAQAIYGMTVGQEHPASLTDFVHDVTGTGPGVAMTVFGVGAGFLFAVLVLCTSLVSFPLLLDRNVTIEQAVSASIAAARENPRLVTIWGAIVAAGLVLGAAPGLAGLIVTMPVLGHATWHLYRRLLPR